MAEPAAAGVIVRSGFLPLPALARVLTALDRLAARWTPSETLRLTAHGGSAQIAPGDLVAKAPLDEVREIVAPAALQWARASGYRFPAPPQLQMFPVRMVGRREQPAYQDPHVDSRGDLDRPPVCANVFYATARGVEGGELEVAARDDGDLADPVVVRPAPNTLVSFPGGRVHRVAPLYAGERVSLVINFY